MVKEAFDLLGETFMDGIDAVDAICQHLAENAVYDGSFVDGLFVEGNDISSRLAPLDGDDGYVLAGRSTCSAISKNNFLGQSKHGSKGGDRFVTPITRNECGEDAPQGSRT